MVILYLNINSSYLEYYLYSSAYGPVEQHYGSSMVKKKMLQKAGFRNLYRCTYVQNLVLDCSANPISSYPEY